MPQDYSDANLAATVNSHSVSWVNDLKNSRLTWVAWSVTLCTLLNLERPSRSSRAPRSVMFEEIP